METMSLDVSPREILGKKVKVLRRKAMIPLHLYGKGIPSQALQGEGAAVTRAINHVGHHIPLYLKFDGDMEQIMVFVQEVQRHPVTDQIFHVDLYQVDVTQKMQGEVPITLVGEAPAVRIHRGILFQSLYNLSVECLPRDMPERIDVDISHLEELDQSIRVEDITLGPEVTILSDPEELVVRVSPLRVEEVVGLPAEERPEMAKEDEGGKEEK